jgi:hypothetical protein
MNLLCTFGQKSEANDFLQTVEQLLHSGLSETAGRCHLIAIVASAYIHAFILFFSIKISF